MYWKHGPCARTYWCWARALAAMYCRRFTIMRGQIDAVELDRNVIDLVGERFHEFAGNLYTRPEVHVHEAEARGFANATR